MRRREFIAMPAMAAAMVPRMEPVVLWHRNKGYLIGPIPAELRPDRDGPESPWRRSLIRITGCPFSEEILRAETLEGHLNLTRTPAMLRWAERADKTVRSLSLSDGLQLYEIGDLCLFEARKDSGEYMNEDHAFVYWRADAGLLEVSIRPPFPDGFQVVDGQITIIQS